MAGIETKVGLSHPEAKTRTYNPYFSDLVLSQQQLLPLSPCHFIARVPDLIPEATTQHKAPKAKAYRKPREKKRSVQRPVHSKEVYEFLDL